MWCVCDSEAMIMRRPWPTAAVASWGVERGRESETHVKAGANEIVCPSS